MTLITKVAVFLFTFLMKCVTIIRQLLLSHDINFLTRIRKLESSPVLLLKRIINRSSYEMGKTLVMRVE